MKKLRALIDKWRREASTSREPIEQVLDDCANELEEVLSENDKYQGQKPETD